MPKKKEAIGDVLRSLREAKELGQQQLADQAGLTMGGLSRIERGERNPRYETVVALLGALGYELRVMPVR